MSPLARIACWLGFHVYDRGELFFRKVRGARMGVDIRRGLLTHCDRCGRGFWR